MAESLFGELRAEVESASGGKDLIVRTLDGTMVFRVYHALPAMIQSE